MHLKAQGAVQHGTKIDRKLADYIAMGMKRGASRSDTLHTLVSAYRNYCRKHDAFEIL
jgi:glutamine synthetase